MVPVSDVDRAKRFYEKLGFSLGYRLRRQRRLPGDPVHSSRFGGGFHAGTKARAPGPDPQRRSYGSYASFSDPDGNGWLLQEIKERLPGR